MKYKLEVKQLVAFPYCRIYRSFINSVICNPNIHKRGSGLLFHFMVLFTLANYRPSYRTLDGQRYHVAAGEWVARYSDLCERMHVRYYYQMANVLRRLQEMRLIEYTLYQRQKLVRFKICCWKKTNTCLDYSAPCQKDMGFFFFPIHMTEDLVALGKCSEADMLLDLWLHTVYNDPTVAGSASGPLVYMGHNEGSPLLSFSVLAARWSVSSHVAACISQAARKLRQDAHTLKMLR